MNTRQTQYPFLIRAIWFVFIGSWLSALIILLGYVCIATIVLMPLGFWFLNRVPQAQTLRQRRTGVTVIDQDGTVSLHETSTKQYPWYLRLMYLPLGLVLGLVWLTVAWVVSLLIITLPLSVWMINRAPTVITLEQF